MKQAKIVWKMTGLEVGSFNGIVNGRLMFIIDKKGKRNPKYVLQSYPFKNDIFTKANNTKKLKECSTLEMAQAFAEHYLQHFVSLFVDKSDKPFSPATLVLLTIYHVQYNMSDGVSLSPIDTLIEIAQSFEKKYNDSNRNWEDSKIDWENALIKHYNKYAKDCNWMCILPDN